MTFVHGYLLAGLVVLGVPVLIHLLNRQKPQQMPFPAFRFLKLKRATNRRRMRLQNLLLLLARLLVLLLVIFALARPQLRGEKTPLSGTQPVLAVLIFDTSPSMDYTSAGETRLDEARTRAKELLAQFAPESKIRVIETGELMPPVNDLSGWIQGRSVVESRIGGLRTRPVVEPLPRLVEGGVALLARAVQEDNRPRMLVVFGDRTVPSWPGGAGKKVPEDIQAFFVDIGIEKPRDLAIESIETRPALVVPGAKLEVAVSVRAVGAEFNTELNCLFENEADPDPAQTRQPVRLGDGQRRRYVFQRKVPLRPKDALDAPVQIVASLRGSDALAFNNTAYATVPVRSKRKLLLIADEPKKARPVRLAIQTIEADRPADAFEVVQKTEKETLTLKATEWQDFSVAILHQLAEPKVALWDALGAFVENGGGLIIIPGGDEVERSVDVFNAEGERVHLLPGTLKRLVKVPEGQPGVRWKDFQRGHALTGAFLDMQRAGRVDFDNPTTAPQVLGYWEVEPNPKALVISTYNVPRGEWAAVLEMRRGRGRVLMFTLPLDGRQIDATRSWHNYWKDSSFGQVLLDLACQDLAGRVSLPSLNFQRGQEVRLAPPSPLPPAPFKLIGPGLSESETRVNWNVPANAGAPGAPLPDLVLPQATSAGNYQLRDSKDRVFMGFSISEPAEESNLARVPVETIEAVLGEKAVRQVVHGIELKTQLGTAPPTELLPLVLIALLALLVLESWMANRYYKPVKETEEQAKSLRPTGELTRSRL
jgi:hypothetical protein